MNNARCAFGFRLSHAGRKLGDVLDRCHPSPATRRIFTACNNLKWLWCSSARRGKARQGKARPVWSRLVWSDQVIASVHLLLFSRQSHAHASWPVGRPAGSGQACSGQAGRQASKQRAGRPVVSSGSSVFLILFLAGCVLLLST